MRAKYHVLRYHRLDKVYTTEAEFYTFEEAKTFAELCKKGKCTPGSEYEVFQQL